MKTSHGKSWKIGCMHKRNKIILVSNFGKCKWQLSHFISWNACVHWIPLPLISYSMVLEMLSHVSTKKTKQFLDQLILMDYCTSRNIVSTVNLGCKLDLKKIALHARNAEYNPKVEV